MAAPQRCYLVLCQVPESQAGNRQAYGKLSIHKQLPVKDPERVNSVPVAKLLLQEHFLAPDHYKNQDWLLVP